MFAFMYNVGRTFYKEYLQKTFKTFFIRKINMCNKREKLHLTRNTNVALVRNPVGESASVSGQREFG